MPANNSLRYVLIGGGASIAATHLMAIRRLPIQIVGLSDIDPVRGEPRAQEIGCPFYTDTQVMLDTLKPDAAVICTPHPSHPDLAIECLRRGIHVLVEKPMAVDVASADRMVTEAERSGKIMAVNFQHRFRPVIERAHALIQSGALGELTRVLVIENWLRTAAYYRSASWRGRWDTEGGGILMNQAPHTLDVLCHLVGLPERLWGRISTRFHAMECEDTAQAMLEYAHDTPGYLTASTVETGDPCRIQIIGDRAGLELLGEKLTIRTFDPSLREFMQTSPDFFSTPGISIEETNYPLNENVGNHYAVHKDFLESIQTGRTPRCTGREALMSLELANAVYYSSMTGQPVTFPLDRAAYSEVLENLKQTHH